MAILETRDIHSGYGEVQILWGVTLKLEPGKLTTLVGSNGVGKTCLIHAIMGLERPKQGSVWYEGRDITRVSTHQRAAEGLILVPEGRQLFTDLTVHENLELGAVSARSRPKVKENVEKVFELFPRLKERQHQKSGTMSGGEQQMLAVGRGLMAEPKVLILDELSLGLSPKMVLYLFEILQKLKAGGLTMLLVEQNVHMALAVSDYAYVLREGKMAIEGTAAEMAENAEVREAYLAH